MGVYENLLSGKDNVRRIKDVNKRKERKYDISNGRSCNFFEWIYIC